MLSPQTPDTLDVAGITATRSAVTSSSAPLRRISATGLSHTGAISVQEAVRTFAGISVKDYGGIGGMKTVSIRNFGAQHTGICYDGIDFSDAMNGQVDIGRFNLEEVESISVEIAGSDDIFRSARLAGSAGVLSIETRRPASDTCGTRATVRMRAASFGSWSPYAGISRRLGRRWSAGAWAEGLFSEGSYPFVLKNGNQTTHELRLNSDVRSAKAELNVNGDVGADGGLDFKCTWSDSERGLPGSVILYAQNPTERLWSNDLTANLRYKTKFGGKWRFKADAGYRDASDRYVDNDPAYRTPADDRYRQREAKAGATAMWTPAARLSFSLAEDLSFAELDANLKGFQFPRRVSSYSALSAKYSGDRLTVAGTLLGTMMHEMVQEGDASPARRRISPSASVSYRLPGAEDLRLRLSCKDSYRLPTFTDIYYPKVGSRDLRPEKAFQSNLGLTWYKSLGAGSISATADLYHNRVRDKIVAIPTMFIWSMRNVGEVNMTGTDLSASFTSRCGCWSKLRGSCCWSWQRAVDVTDPSAKNYRHQIPYTPRNTGSASIVLETRWLNLGYTAGYVGERYSLAQNTEAYRIMPYSDQSVSLNGDYQIGGRHRCMMHISVEVLNLLGENYEIIKYYPMPGRSWRLTVKFTL